MNLELWPLSFAQLGLDSEKDKAIKRVAVITEHQMGPGLDMTSSAMVSAA